MVVIIPLDKKLEKFMSQTGIDPGLHQQAVKLLHYITTGHATLMLFSSNVNILLVFCKINF